jgi:hypothetical protein
VGFGAAVATILLVVTVALFVLSQRWLGGARGLGPAA